MIYLDRETADFKNFPNGEEYLEKDLLGRYSPSTKVTLKYEDDRDLMRLLILRRLGFRFLTILYMPYSRMDRENKFYPFSLKYVCEYLNWLDFFITVIEPHSDVSMALLNNSKAIFVTPNILMDNTGYNGQKDWVCYPDTGAYKRYFDLVKSPKSLIAFKQRDFATGKIKETKIIGKGSLSRGSKVFIVDDLCSKGGTFLEIAKQLRSRAMGKIEINLVVAHCEDNIHNGELLTTDWIDKIYTTNSLLTEGHEKIFVKDII